MRALSAGEFVERTMPWVEQDLGRALDGAERNVYTMLAPLVQERVKLLAEVAVQVRFLFTAIDWDERSWQKVMTKEAARDAVESALAELVELESWDAGAIEAACRAVVERLDLSAGKVFQPLRVAVTGSSVSPPLFESMEALGREETLHRLARALEVLDSSLRGRCRRPQG